MDNRIVEQPLPELFFEIAPENALRCLMKNVGAAVFIARDNKIEFINEVFEELSGYSWQEMRGKAVTSFVHRQNKNAVMKYIEGLDEAGDTTEKFEYRLVKKDGTFIWVLMSIALAQCGDTFVMIGSFVDVTSRREIAVKFRHSEQRFKMLFEYAPDAYYLSDTKGVFVDGNKVAESMLGYSKEELIGKNYLDLHILSPAQVPKAVKLLAKNALGHSTGPDEFLLARKDGSLVPVSIRTIPLKIGGKVQVLGIARDISELKKKESQLELQARVLSEHLKQLNCLYEISTIKTSPGLSLDEMLQKIVDLIPASFRYPESTCARIMLDGREFKTADLRTTPYKLSEDITVNGISHGVVEVYCYERKNVLDDGFTQEERKLLIAIARHIVDIKVRKQAEDAVKEIEEKFRAISLAAQDAIIIIDGRGDITYWNRAAENIFGYKDNEVIGKELHRIIAPDKYYDAYRKGFKKFRETGRGKAIGQTLDMEAIKKDGSIFPVELSLTAVKSKGYWNAIAIVRDVTLRKKYEDKLLYLAGHDQLTGLPNRALFNDRLSVAFSHAARYQKELAVMIIDMDNFKNINDTMGHNTGDRLLKAVAERMTAHVRRSDTVARIGGDEFCLVAELNEAQTELKVAGKMVEAFSQPFILNGFHINATLSIGVAVYPRDGKDIDTLMKKADVALYRAKDAGRNRFCVYCDK